MLLLPRLTYSNLAQYPMRIKTLLVRKALYKLITLVSTCSVTQPRCHELTITDPEHLAKIIELFMTKQKITKPRTRSLNQAMKTLIMFASI